MPLGKHADKLGMTVTSTRKEMVFPKKREEEQGTLRGGETFKSRKINTTSRRENPLDARKEMLWYWRQEGLFIPKGKVEVWTRKGNSRMSLKRRSSTTKDNRRSVRIQLGRWNSLDDHPGEYFY